MNALTGAGIARALVALNARSVLTDSEGRFAFPDFTDSAASAMVSKPGFSPTATGSAMGGVARQRIMDLDATLDLKLYPDAVISGTLTDGEGQPLERVGVVLLRQTLQPDGMRWQPVRTVQTTHRGEFRFREPAGRFRLSVNAVVRADAVLPVVYPGQTSSDGLNYFEAAPGEEKQIDLRARTSPTYQVTVRLDAAERGMQFSAVTGSGESFQVPLAGQTNAGVLVLLPTGSFTLRARLESREAVFTGSARVTVIGPRTDPVAMHLEPAASLPVELSVDETTSSSSSTSTGIAQVLQAPNVRQFNLRLERLDEAASMPNQDIQLRANDDKTESFQVPPGRYRLVANAAGGAWFIESATYGLANLMTSDISIGSGGGGGTPIRLVVSNARGTVSGTVKLPANPSGTADTIWVYMIPKGPSLGPINPIGLGNNGSSTGPFTQMLPPGSYLAVAMDHRSEQDLRDPEVQAKLSTAAKTVEVTVGATANVDLELLTGAFN